MREIKFRAWDIENKFMVDDKSYVDLSKVLFNLNGEMLIGDDYCGSCSQYKYSTEENKTVELMQYTGMTDKNGKEIYEGDIVKYDRNINSTVDAYLFTVEWDVSQYVLVGKYSYMDDCIVCELTEVIGNIYENEDLINNS